MQCLLYKYGEFLNDSLIEFAAYKMLDNFSDETLSKVELFSTQFYTKLTSVPSSHQANLSKEEQRHGNVARWTRNKNVFDKRIHFYPINEELTHWYLIMVLIPDMSKGLPYVAVLDSVGGKKDVAVENIRSYLIEELKQRKIDSITVRDIRAMATEYPNIPTEPDGSSCGLYVLHYMERILMGIEEKCLSAVFSDTSNWFRHDIDKKRFKISRLILSISTIKLPDLQFFPTAAQDKHEKRNELKKETTE